MKKFYYGKTVISETTKINVFLKVVDNFQLNI